MRVDRPREFVSCGISRWRDSRGLERDTLPQPHAEAVVRELRDRFRELEGRRIGTSILALLETAHHQIRQIRPAATPQNSLSYCRWNG